MWLNFKTGRYLECRTASASVRNDRKRRGRQILCAGGRLFSSSTLALALFIADVGHAAPAPINGICGISPGDRWSDVKALVDGDVSDGAPSVLVTFAGKRVEVFRHDVRIRGTCGLVKSVRADEVNLVVLKDTQAHNTVLQLSLLLAQPDCAEWDALLTALMGSLTFVLRSGWRWNNVVLKQRFNLHSEDHTITG